MSFSAPVSDSAWLHFDTAMPFHRSNRRISLGFAALGLAALSNYLFTGEWITRFSDAWVLPWGPQQITATACLVGAILCAAFCFWSGDDFKWSGRSEGPRQTLGAATPRLPSQENFVPFLLVYAAGTAVYFCAGENSSVRWLWLASIAALIWPHLRGASFKGFGPITFSEYMLLGFVVCAAFAVRYNDLVDVPLHVDNDVSIMGLFSKKLVVTNDWRWIGMAPTQHQYSEHQYIALCMRLFGTDMYGVAMLGVLAGTATVAATYFLGKIAFNRWVGLLAASFLAFNYVHIHFSRIIFGPLSTLLLVGALVFLVQGLRSGSRLSFVLGGVSLGAGLLSYYSARVGPLIAAASLILWCCQRKKYPHITWGHWALGIAGMFAAFGPNLAFALSHFESFTGRGNDVVIWTSGAWDHLAAKYNIQGDIAKIWVEQIRRTLLSPFYYPDESTICYLRKPMLGGFTVLSFALGLGYMVTRLKRAECVLLVAWSLLTLLLGGVLTIDPPFWPHLNIVVPALALIAAVGAERFCRSLVLHGGRRFAYLVPSALAALVVAFGVHNADVYTRFASVHSGPRTRAVRLIRGLSQDYKTYLISKSVRWEQEAFQFVAAGSDGKNLADPTTDADLPEITRPTAFFVFNDADPKTISILNKAFPYARKRAFFDGWDAPAFTMYNVFPTGYIEQTPRASATTPSIWSLPGWYIVSFVLLSLIGYGWHLLHREHHFHLRRRTPPGPRLEDKRYARVLTSPG